MNFYILLIIYTFLNTVHVESNEEEHTYDRVQRHNELNRQLRNYLCCLNKMRCCKRKESAPEVQIRAVLLRCPGPVCEGSTVSRRLNRPTFDFRDRDVKQFQGFDEDEPIPPYALSNCRKKLVVTMKIFNPDVRQYNYEYIVIDHVYDPGSKKRQRLLTPYVIKFKQEPIMQMYAMKFLHVVNAHAREEVLNKQLSNFTGCNTASRKPTCGRIKYKGKVVPYSEGFCCSCDPDKNKNMQPESLNEESDSVISYSDPAFILDGIECPQNLKDGQNTKDDENETSDFKYESILPQIIESLKRTAQKKATFPKANNNMPNHQHKRLFGTMKDLIGTQTVSKRFNEEDDASDVFREDARSNNVVKQPFYKYLDISKPSTQQKVSKNFNEDMKTADSLFLERKLPKSRKGKRQVQASGSQIRGGQNCADRYTPTGLDPETYHESAHCLRFSDMWYTVYRLQEPVVEHSIVFEVFERHEGLDGLSFWKDIIKGKQIKVGTIVNHYLDKTESISLKYKSRPTQSANTNKFALDYKADLLLIPEGIREGDIKEHSEIKGGPAEYLVVHSNQISLDGDQCNVAGVGFEAFVKQPNRCARPKGTCLLNQPYHLWKHDYLAEKQGKKGCFFLKYFGNLPENPIRKHVKTNQQYLLMEYSQSYASTVDFEIRADFNTLLRSQSPGVITEVYVDSTSQLKTILTVKITNSGLVSSSFIARLSDCPLEMPASFNNIESQPVLIPPQHQHVFHLKIKCVLPTDRFHCSVEALNYERELVAIRRIRIQRLDRCICTWHCLCACAGSFEGLQCVPMSLQQYHAAGFQGSLPVTTHLIHYTLADEVLSFMFYIMLFLILILLLLGLSKALIGICCSPAIGILGLDVILDLPKPIRRYYECNLADRQIVYDREGWPIDPDTKERVRSIGRSTEFCMNIIFFFAYPINVCILLIKRVYCLPCKYNKRKAWSKSPSKDAESKYLPEPEQSCWKFLRFKYKTKGLTSSLAHSGSTKIAGTSTDDDDDDDNDSDDYFGTFRNDFSDDDISLHQSETYEKTTDEEVDITLANKTEVSGENDSSSIDDTS